MDKYMCVHGHFYQPPRENPWLEAVELQDSAYPYHDWNERVTAECYAPNSASRILDGDQRVMDIVSNYAKISFNFGPTVLMWMENASTDLYRAILEADRQSGEWRSGHGAAIAQVYNHLIMPLANTRDKRSQVIWGIADFRYRFGRFPEGMWLSETAVDLETLDILAEQEIRFTILAPSQAARFRKIGEEDWTEVEGTSIDPTMPYLCKLPSRREIVIFFYDGPISRAVAFEKLLNSGESFAGRLIEGFAEGRDRPQLLHIATDGESYGHHHKFGDMALAAALNYIETNNLAQLTSYGEFLEHHPPTHEAEVHENTSWSCFHGIERWRSNCGCNSGGHAEWNQEWRLPLRAALDWLRDRLATEYERHAGKYLKNPWLARDDYIHVILDRSEENRASFFERHASRQLSDGEKITVLKLMEIQRHAMLMYTSCGWFFDELSGLETVQVIQYAGRTLQLAAGLFEAGLEQGFLEKLAQARSNIPEHEHGARIYEKFVLPAQVDLTKVAVHFAFSSLFHDYAERTRIFSYTVQLEDYDKRKTEDVTLATGRIRIVSEITLESDRLMFCVIRFGRHDFKGGVCRCSDDAACSSMKEELNAVFEKGLFTEIVALIDTYFGTHSYSLADLFRDEQRAILEHIIDATMERFKHDYHSMYEHNRHLMEFVQETGMPVPKAFLTAASVSLGTEFREELAEEDADAEKVKRIVAHMKRWGVEVTAPENEIFVRRHMEKLMNDFSGNPSAPDLLNRIRLKLELLGEIQLEFVLWGLQNVYYRMAKTIFSDFAEAAGKGDEEAAAWVEDFRHLGEMLRMNLGSVLPA